LFSFGEKIFILLLHPILPLLLWSNFLLSRLILVRQQILLSNQEAYPRKTMQFKESTERGFHVLFENFSSHDDKSFLILSHFWSLRRHEKRLCSLRCTLISGVSWSPTTLKNPSI
jgi:hypothetical protein